MVPSTKFFVYWAIAIGVALIPGSDIMGVRMLGLLNIAVLLPLYLPALGIGLSAPPEMLKAIPPDAAMGVYFLVVAVVLMLVLSLLNAKIGRPFAYNLGWYGMSVMLFLDALLFGACPIGEGLSNGMAAAKCYWPGMIMSHAMVGLQ